MATELLNTLFITSFQPKFDTLSANNTKSYTERHVISLTTYSFIPRDTVRCLAVFPLLLPFLALLHLTFANLCSFPRRHSCVIVADFAISTWCFFDNLSLMAPVQDFVRLSSNYCFCKTINCNLVHTHNIFIFVHLYTFDCDSYSFYL